MKTGMHRVMTSDALNRSSVHHPCYSEEAHRHFARMHLAVAPRCNVQCNYCNRRYDCANESRPGVVSEQLTPEEALAKVRHVSSRMKELSVVGIAGPGDPLANPWETFKTLRLIRENFPDLIPCFSTNGLALCDHIREIVAGGIKHITVTINTFVPKTAEKIYQWILVGGKKAYGRDAMAYLIQKQIEGVRLLVQHGCLVKINSVLIPGVNDAEFPFLSRRLKAMGIYIHNIMPLISRAEYGTVFAAQGVSEPSSQLIERTRKACEGMRQMTHCRQCRADAVGMLDNDLSHMFGKKNCTDLQIKNNGYEDRERWKAQVASRREPERTMQSNRESDYLLALCSAHSQRARKNIATVPEFEIYRVRNGNPTLINVRRVSGRGCAAQSQEGGTTAALADVIALLHDCKAVICGNISSEQLRQLQANGIAGVTSGPHASPAEAVAEAEKEIAAMPAEVSSEAPSESAFVGAVTV